MSNCSHLAELAQLQAPRLSQSVHREECTQCFDNQDLPSGIDVCLTCFNGGCLSDERHHAGTHAQRAGHPFTLNVKRKLKPSPQRPSDEEPPAKMKKLAIVEDREEDKYTHVTTVKCWRCDPAQGAELPPDAQLQLQSLIDGTMRSISSARQSEVQAWEEEIVPCEHTLTLEQFASSHIQASGLAHCQSCDLKENLWLCLTCGSLGCGRQLYGGVGGNGHGLKHFEESRHPVSVKLGTITPEGGADIYCYVCDDTKLDPALAQHLATFGINVSTQTKTEKSMTELQIEHNLNYDFSLTGEDGQALEPVFGPGLTGLANLGNSCYIASVIQTLFALPTFQKRYSAAAQHWAACTEPLPADCVECQMFKLADGLLSGRYAHPASHYAPAAETPVFQAGVRPGGFKALVGKGHAEFATMKQQDAEEFFGWLVTVLRRQAKKAGRPAEAEPTEAFAFGMEQRLECSECGRVRYRVDSVDNVSLAVPARETADRQSEAGKKTYEEVLLEELLGNLTSPEVLEYHCPACAKGVHAKKQTRFATFPEVLVVHAKKFQLVNWVPTKLDIPVVLPEDDILILDKYIGRGLQDGEVALPETDASDAPAAPQFDAGALAQLEGMGFPLVRCQKALLATGNTGDAEAAMEWLFAHMEDPDIDAPIELAASSNTSVSFEPSPDQIRMLADMGFTSAQARKALRETGGDAERAVEWLFNHPGDTGEDAAVPSATPAAAPTSPPGSSALPAKYRLKAFISHKGPSVHSGHYVAHIRTAEGWVLFNDEKVVKADDESVRNLKRLAYLYVFEKV
ncbi:hypothetical protein PLICRDRAFT_46628 [Plicaturopsis crispa FD-325 SS-3]|uniref:Ubiquitin carboxyl-terminal hydrolase n=1 Tax=Plicaturopsis crispa FD-325 SS-3 TaxID=944288 RepID=A0A0C9SQK4_PLICR|nr:hypothetical protein PLICRDRAFT_46628 [Plicaturopsis crispa FD-325 SS-3]